MHKLIEYVCDELEEIERKADKDGKLSMAEMQYVDLLAHTKKNLLKAEEMSEEMEYSNSMDGGSYGGSYNNSYRNYSREGGNSYRGGSYARGRGRNARRDARGRYSSEGYSRAGEEMVEQLREMMEDAPDEQTRKEFQRFISKVEQI